MTSPWRTLRRQILTPNVRATRLDVRGFHEKNRAARENLETVGRSFLSGYAYAMEARHPRDAEQPLEKLTVQYRGFAYEGAGMGFAMLDGLPGGGRGRVIEFLKGRAVDHAYMVYVGIGWAMARVPRFRWPQLIAPDPLLRWLVLDGYGFHQAYFKTKQYVTQQYVERDFPWPAGSYQVYANNVIDQGIGRAMWFVGGSDPSRVAKMINSFAAERQADLWAGTGLAATYAGGGDEGELNELRKLAGQYLPQVAQGSAFAAKARIRAGLMVPHVDVATRILTGLSAEQAAQVTDDALPERAENGVPGYERWRKAIADNLMTIAKT